LRRVGQRPIGEGDPADRLTGRPRAQARDDLAITQLPHQRDHRAQSAIAFEDQADNRRFGFVNHQLSIDDFIAERHDAALCATPPLSFSGSLRLRSSRCAAALNMTSCVSESLMDMDIDPSL
jgi:hypothetical protein